MTSVFESFTINKMVLNNRFVRSATMDNLARDGIVSEPQLELYGRLGRGEIGLIISHGLYPVKEGQCSPGQLSVHTDDSIASLHRLVKVVHQGGGKIAAQILHGGWMCSQDVTGVPPVGPSEIIHPLSKVKVRQLSSDEISELVDDYVQAARRIIEAGFDGVQLHGAHSWLISAFLSPATNKRQDRWGGSIENRTRFVREIFRGMRKIAGPDYPIFIKLGIKDYHPEGKSVNEGVATAKLLQQNGCDAIEVSEGLEQDFFHHIRGNAVNPYYLEECKQVKQAVSIPVILVGGIRKLEEMQQVLENGTADAVSMCRPFIMNPNLVTDLQKGADNSPCTSCNKCMASMREQQLRCVLI